MTTAVELKALKLWQAAEGIAPHGFKSQREAQFALSESVASGEFPTAILPAVRQTVTQVYDRVETKHDQFTTRKTVQAIEVDEPLQVFKFEDQSNIPGTNKGDKFVPGGLPRLLPREKYPQIGFTASGKSLRASKMGEAFGLDWETIVRTRGARVDLLREAFSAFGRHAKQQEDIDVAKLLVGASGFRTASGQALNGAYAVPGNPDLADPMTIANALEALLQRTVGDATVGQTLPNYDGFTLLVGRGMSGAANRALNTRTVTRVPARTGTDSASTGVQYEETIALAADVNVVEWDWLNRINPDFGKGWLLVPRVSGDELPVLTSNYLEGYEQPSVWIKDSNARTVGGGTVNPTVDGDFDSDAVETKVRHVHGATALWTSAIGFSAGTNS